MFYLTFDTGFRLGEGEEEDRDTLCLTLETKGVTAVRESKHISPTVIVMRQEHKSISQSRCVQDRCNRSQHARSWRVEPIKGAAKVAASARFVTSCFVAHFAPLPSNL